MPKKPTTNKRLDNLFKDINPEEINSKPKRKTQKETPHPSADPKPVQKKTETVPAPKPVVKNQSPALIQPELALAPAPVVTQENIPSSYAVNIHTGFQDWSTLRVVDEGNGRQWTEDEELLVKQVSDQLSLALENARLFQETQKRASELATLNDIVRAISEQIELKDVLKTAYEKIASLVAVDAFFVALYDETKNIVSYPIIIDDGVSFDEMDRTLNPDNFTGKTIVSGKSTFITVNPEDLANTTVKNTTIGNSRESGTLLFLPLRSGSKTIGCLSIQSYAFFAYNQDDVALLENIANQISIGIQNAKLYNDARRSNEELRKSQEQYALAAEGANDGLWDWDIANNQIYYSPRWKSMLGYEVNELTKGFEDWENLIHPDNHDYAVTALDNYLTGKTDAYDVEIRLQHKNGTWRWIRDRGKALRDADGKAIRMAGSHSDITDQKTAEESIRRRNEYLAASSEIGKIVTSTLDLNSIFARTVNLIIERFSFYHASIFIVEETGFNVVLRESTGEAGAEMKRNKHSLQVNDKSIVGKVALDGKAVIVNDVVADPFHKFNPLLPETRAEAAIPLRIGNRTIGAIDIQSKNTGAFKDDEVSVLQTVADQVAVAIDNARSFELSQQAVMEMREIDRLKSQFLANMSHELRTPLNSIIGFSRVIIKGIDGPVTELQQQDLTAIYNSGQHLLGLINDILDLSKIEAGKMELAFDEVNIADVTSSVLSTMSGLIKDRPIQMKRIIEPNLPTVRADAIRIRQVMINLLSNASKFTDEGDILVEVGLKPGQTGRNEMRISVTDTGPGISKQDQTKLFQPFSQVDDSPTRKTGGTGLGLSICQHIINMHGGRIWIESDVGKGSTFHFTLPLFRKEKENSLTPGGNKIILAIDDDPQVTGLYERYLQPQGYQVIPLSDPLKAVERVKQVKPFAVTLDIMMPGVDGWQVLDNLKSDPETRDIPIIVCSIIDDFEKGFNLGATDYLVKPILEDDIVNALDRLNSDGSIREVLVIDDDPDDLRLIGKILNTDGRYKAILAEGGRMGWDIISSGNPPHAVILDLFMPEIDGFKILENMQASEKLRDIPVIVISGMDISTEQKNQLNEFGQRLLSKAAFNEKELLTSIQRSLERVHAKNK